MHSSNSAVKINQKVSYMSLECYLHLCFCKLLNQLLFFMLPGRVEWRGDPREPHKRYLSSWDLTVISDTDEVDAELSSHSAEKNISLPNLSVGHGGSLDSIQSLGVLDSPMLSRRSADSQGKIHS